MITNRSQFIIKTCVDQGFPLATGDAEKILTTISSVKHATLDKPLVVGDINPEVAGHDIEARLLKVLEDLQISAMFVSSRDVFSETFMSRFMSVVKEGHVHLNNHNSKMFFVNMMRDADVPHEKALLDILKEAPSMLPYYMSYKQSRLPAKHKLTEFLGKL